MPTRTATRIVPDEVWATIDPHAGRLSRREGRGVLAVIAAVVVMAAAIGIGVVLGVVNPRIEAVATTWQFRPARHEVRMRVSFRADARASVHATAVRVEGPGDPAIIAPTPAPFTIAGRSSDSVSVDVRVRDCSTVRRADVIQFRLVIDQFWGHLTTTPDWEQGLSNEGPQFTWQACH